MQKIVVPALAAVLSISLAGSAQALNTRTWVSGTGVDQTGCGAIATPCRTLQYAHDNTAASGEIDVKDSAGYGSVVITKSISIVGNGTIAGVLASANGNAITVTASVNDLIVLRGLTIEGAGIGYNGIVLNSGGTLEIADCVVENFAGNGATGNGILLQPTAGAPTISVSNTTVSNNQFNGVYYFPSKAGSTAAASLVFDRVTASKNGFGPGNLGDGIAIVAINTTSATRASISNTLVANNASAGILIAGPQVDATLDQSSSVRNGAEGIRVGMSAVVNIGRSVSANNSSYGVYNNSGTVLSYGDNRFSGNSAPTSGTITPATLQ